MLTLENGGSWWSEMTSERRSERITRPKYPQIRVAKVRFEPVGGDQRGGQSRSIRHQVNSFKARELSCSVVVVRAAAHKDGR